MRLKSTQNKAREVSFEEALFKGLPEDNGLYMPINIPHFEKQFIETLPRISFQEIACRVAEALIGDEIPKQDLERIIERSMNFEVPLKHLYLDTYCLELFHGPSLAFKDFGARFMAQCMSYFLTKRQRDIHILVATSGDTGSAVAQGFFDAPGIKVTILYPSGKVSPTQEKQLTTLGNNITALEVDGVFDDCQQLVKAAFLDKELAISHGLSSANSINIARLIPQTFYYFEAYARLSGLGKPLVFSTPSGNFGNLCGGLLAAAMGLPVQHFIAATNVNDIVPEYLKTGIFSPRPSVATLSNAMDVGHPSNFPRLLALHDNSYDKMEKQIKGVSFDDVATLEKMRFVYQTYDYLICPHTAIGLLGLEDYRKRNHTEFTGIFLGTAHPAKFSEVVLRALDLPIPLPDSLVIANELPKKALKMPANYKAFKDYLEKTE